MATAVRIEIDRAFWLGADAMNRQELHRLHHMLADLENMEKRISEWREVLEDPKTRFGFRDERAATDDSRTLSVVITSEYPDYGPHRGKPKLVSELWTEASIRSAPQLFLDSLTICSDELRRRAPTAGCRYQ